MKRTVAVILVLTVLASLYSCGKTEPASTSEIDITEGSSAEKVSLTEPLTDEPSGTFFMLDKLPDIGEYSLKEVGSRWYKEYQSTLKPRSDYGTLVPFFGGKSLYNGVEREDEYAGTRGLFGLMTTDGKVVVDPVYKAVSLNDEGKKAVYACTRLAGYGISKKELDSMEQEEYFENYRESTDLIAADGSWSICEENIEYNSMLTGFFPNVIKVVTRSEKKDAEGSSLYNILFYDYDKNLLFSLYDTDETGYYESDGVISLDRGDYNSQTDEYENGVLYFDLKGNRILTQYKGVSEFSGGYAIVELENGKKQLIDKTGRLFLKNPSSFIEIDYYNTINKCGEYDSHKIFIVENNGIYEAYENGKKIIRDVPFRFYLKTIDNKLYYYEFEENEDGFLYSAEDNSQHFVSNLKKKSASLFDDYTFFIGDYEIVPSDHEKGDYQGLGLIYDRKNKKVIYTDKGISYAEYLSDDYLVLFLTYTDENEMSSRSYALFNLNTRKVEFNREFMQIQKTGEKRFLLCSEGRIREVFDENANLIYRNNIL